MKRVAIRIWLTTSALILGVLCTLLVRAGYDFEVKPLGRELDSIPMELGGWYGVDLPPAHDDVLKILNAQSTLDRAYRDQSGGTVVLNLSAWTQPETVSEVAPHVPKICYTNSGWTIVEEREVHVSTLQGDVPLVALLLEQKGDRIVVAYWYQLGNSTFVSASEARRIHRSLWGQRKWPATIKVLIQTSAGSIDEGLPPVERFAGLVHSQISEILNTASL